MKSLFNSNDNQDIIKRINALTPSTKAEWGKMDVGQMLAHCHAALRTAFGDLTPKRSLVGILFGGIAKKKLLSEEPFKRNLPTDKHFVMTGQKNFEGEKNNVVASVQRFVRDGEKAIASGPHPFFGSLTVHEWDRLMWKHLDHHLRQFGA